MTEQYDILIVGGGNAGVSLAAALRRKRQGRVAIADGQQLHRYRPMLNYAAGGQADMARFERPMRAVIPDGVEWIPDHVVAVDAEERTAVTSTGLTVGFRHLVLCPGLTPWWGAIDGLREAYAAGWAASAHVPEHVDAARALLRQLGFHPVDRQPAVQQPADQSVHGDPRHDVPEGLPRVAHRAILPFVEAADSPPGRIWLDVGTGEGARTVRCAPRLIPRSREGQAAVGLRPRRSTGAWARWSDATS